ncbi:MAG: hypothetical protein RUMPE_00571 [Eubacteriales bacterium SKADARSKE-1]|nr:hypothetical protein [Eubacteriales bacterium SKADARSKE-1]
MKFLSGIFKNNNLIVVKKYSDISPEPLFLCEKKENFFKRFLGRENFVFLRFGERNKKKKKKIITLILVPVVIIAILTGGICVSVNKTENKNKTLFSPKSDIIESKESIEETKKFLVLNNSQSNNEDLKVDLTTFGKIKCDKKMVASLKNLISSARKIGYNLEVTEGYTDSSVRKKVYEDEILRLRNEENYTLARAEAAALKTISPYYEHETGLCVNITAQDLLSSDFINTDEYGWLIRNCIDYGFVIRTPQSKENKTGLCFDSTLYRYVGVENARKMRTLNMCIEEYRKYLKIKN